MPAPTVKTTRGGFCAVTFGRHAFHANSLDREELRIASQLVGIVDERAAPPAFIETEWDDAWHGD